MKKIFAPHEPEEEVLSAADAIQDAEQSEARWQAFEKGEKMCRVTCRVAAACLLQTGEAGPAKKKDRVSSCREVITGLVDVFVLPDEKA